MAGVPKLGTVDQMSAYLYLREKHGSSIWCASSLEMEGGRRVDR